MFGGSGEIRTHGRRKPSPVFKTGAFNHSAKLPFVEAEIIALFSQAPNNAFTRPAIASDEVNPGDSNPNKLIICPSKWFGLKGPVYKIRDIIPDTKNYKMIFVNSR